MPPHFNYRIMDLYVSIYFWTILDMAHELCFSFILDNSIIFSSIALFALVDNIYLVV